MDPTEWGPAGWKFLHSITFAQPDKPNLEQQKYLKQFFGALGYVLPCQKCGEHYREYLQKNPIPVDSRESLTRWLVDVHNNSNAEDRSKLPVKVPLFTYEDAVNKYAYDDDILKNPTRKSRSPNCIVLIIVGFFIVSLLVACVGMLVYACTGTRSCPLHRI